MKMTMSQVGYHGIVLPFIIFALSKTSSRFTFKDQWVDGWMDDGFMHKKSWNYGRRWSVAWVMMEPNLHFTERIIKKFSNEISALSRPFAQVICK